jgi:hypothetical protein
MESRASFHVRVVSSVGLVKCAVSPGRENHAVKAYSVYRYSGRHIFVRDNCSHLLPANLAIVVLDVLLLELKRRPATQLPAVQLRVSHATNASDVALLITL